MLLTTHAVTKAVLSPWVANFGCEVHGPGKRLSPACHTAVALKPAFATQLWVHFLGSVSQRKTISSSRASPVGAKRVAPGSLFRASFEGPKNGPFPWTPECGMMVWLSALVTCKIEVALLCCKL